MKTPVSAFLDYLASAWGPKITSPTELAAHAVAGDQGQKWLQTHDAGSGPYEITSFVPNQKYVLKRSSRVTGDQLGALRRGRLHHPAERHLSAARAAEGPTRRDPARALVADPGLARPHLRGLTEHYLPDAAQGAGVREPQQGRVHQPGGSGGACAGVGPSHADQRGVRQRRHTVHPGLSGW